MGIKNLTALLRQLAPKSFKEKELKHYNGRKVAIDASMAIYQFLVAIRTASASGAGSMQLTNENGEVTSHLQGILYRTLRLLDHGVKPVCECTVVLFC